MKKYISLLILFIMSICFVGCHKEPEIKKYQQYSCLILSASDDTSSIQSEYLIDYNIFESSTASKEITVKITDTKEYTGQYQNSKILPYYFIQVDKYIGGDGTEFYVRSDTKKPSSFEFGGGNSYYDAMANLPDIENPEIESLRLARETASQFISIDEYTLYSNEPYEHTEIIDGENYSWLTYDYSFVKTIDGIKTSDMLRIIVNSKGFIRAIHLYRIGEFEKYKDYDVPMESCEEIIEEKIKGIYKDKYVSHEVQDLTLTLTEGNQLALIARVPVSIKEGDTNYSTGVELIIILD